MMDKSVNIRIPPENVITNEVTQESKTSPAAICGVETLREAVLANPDGR